MLNFKLSVGEIFYRLIQVILVTTSTIKTELTSNMMDNGHNMLRKQLRWSALGLCRLDVLKNGLKLLILLIAVDKIS